MEMRYKGRAWKFGHNLCVDGDVLDFRLVIQQVSDPAQLAPHVLERIDPQFAKNCRPGDLIVAGRNFAHGNPHVHGFYGIRGLGVGLIVESLPRGAYRNAVAAGVAFLPHCPGITELVNAGDELEVDFATGEIKNLTSGASHHMQPLPRALLEIIAAGGTTRWMGQQIRQAGRG